MISIDKIEKELKLRLRYPYRWGRKQSDAWDLKTKFIYNTPTIAQLLQITTAFETDLSDYAMNRWYNFWSAMAIESVFAAHPRVKPNTNRRDKLVDFTIESTAFDHKTSVYPKGFGRSLRYALDHKKELINWLYEHQSQQGRKHLSNRIFVLLYDLKYGAHWELKAHVSEIKILLDRYLDNYDPKKLCVLDFGFGSVYSDVIWYIRREERRI